MKATIYYVDRDKTTRDQRADASEGQLLPQACFTRTFERGVPSCFTPRDGGDRNLAICDALYGMYQGERGPLKGLDGKPARSMSVGDVVVLEGEKGLYVCDRAGFRHEPASMEASN